MELSRKSRIEREKAWMTEGKETIGNLMRRRWKKKIGQKKEKLKLKK